jgi:hypothetical protein
MWRRLRAMLAPPKRSVQSHIPDLRRLVLAIRTAAGIEVLVWLTDVAGLSRKEAEKVMRWSAAE